ncbi:hypothetical protein AB0M02_02005 [Actinoplanes sp. NPDC051861]|uniref:hypothetical protein n=1 Tax=Actinoplanes sp. NPDC051861 TaxID=3155170 RepID=UPI00343BA99F
MGDGGGTDWWALRVDEMWSMIERHDGAAHRTLIGGWRKSSELVLQHISHVRRYREDLVTAWPPARSPAAAAYLERLDLLLASLRETYEAAVENHRALSGATGALDSARRAMAEIHREHAANEVRLAAYRADLRLHHLVGGKAKGVPPQPPVAAGRQAHLAEQARQIMSSLSTELAVAKVSIVEPSPFRPPSIREAGSGLMVRAAAESRPPVRAGATGPRLSEVRPSGPVAPEAGQRQPIGHARPADKAGLKGTDSAKGTEGAKDNRGQGRAERRQAVHDGPVRRRGFVFPPVLAPAAPTAGRASTPPTRQTVNPVGGVIGQPPMIANPTRRRTESAPGALRRDTTWPVARGIDPVIPTPREDPADPGPAIRAA